MRIDVLSLFPEFFVTSAEVGVVGRAIRQGLLELHCHNPRDFAEDKHRRVDDRTFGGGPGMVMQVAPLRSALAAIRAQSDTPALTLYLSPQGERLTQRRVRDLAARPRLLLICGRYEGVDERLIHREVDLELSIGDYVLSGGELAAAVLIDAVGRLQEGALNRSESATQDSFEDGLLDCPHYSRPEHDEYGSVPAVLMSGDHAAIERWRRKQSLGRTWLRRPDLLARLQLGAKDFALLEEFRRELAEKK
ncbi:MAG: tRNA (guanosine(37)-N1)-methyltransferase TrmD [Xanthomonadales bacterium]|jgi:tRNA (guanine37-N1)-methyltransferase|nr:tRNA (guanosine(37)-N1)-methyltransferase TrmD [Xanthomonadales bacterium]